ncbi:protein rep [Photobacterium damselae]|nr:protein rep [Photobacterium damselae]
MSIIDQSGSLYNDSDERELRFHAASRLSEGGKGGSLGIVTKTSSPSKNNFEKQCVTNFETGEISPLESTRDYRSERWALKAASAQILGKCRTSKCMVLRAPDPHTGGLRDIEVCKSDKLQKAFYQGLYACGDIWNCPVCAAKVSERRRNELKTALDLAKNKGWGIHFVTLTFPHGAGDNLLDILSKMTKAYGKLSSGKHSLKNQLKKLSEESEIFGFIRALEVTHGKNGFHPHVHMIVFTDKETGSGLLDYVYYRAWVRACRLVGLPEPNRLHGCTVQDGSFASDYVGKWGIEDEMTKANQKQSKDKGVTPWGLLRCVLDGDNPDYPVDRAKNLFRVYSSSFKGKRQLYWSNGLRKLLGLQKELNDQELARKADDEAAYTLANISFEQWKAIRKFKAEAMILNIAESNPSMVVSVISNMDLSGGERGPHLMGERGPS